MASKGIRIGHSQSGELLDFQGPGHVLAIAPTGSGKGTTLLTGATMEFPGSLVLLDSKAELFCITAKKRLQYGDVIRLDPFDLAGKLLKGKVPVPASRYNPMARLQAGSLELGVMTNKISDALIWNEGGGGSSTSNFFVGGAKDGASFIQLGLVEHGAPHEKTLNAVRDVISGAFHNNTVDIFEFAQSIIDRSSDPILRQLAASFVPGAKESRSLDDILRTLRGQTSFLSNAAIAPCLSASDFSFADLKKRVMTVYVVLPLDYMEVCSKFFRLIVASCLSELLSSEKGVPVLIIMDEFANLGFLECVQTAMSMARGYGVQLFPVIQDLSQLSGRIRPGRPSSQTLPYVSSLRHATSKPVSI